MPFQFAGLYSDTLVNTFSGVPYRNTQYTVYASDGITPAPLYTSRTKAVSATNPATTDNYGNATFYADPGLYVISLLGTAVPIEVTRDAAEQSVNGSAALLITGTGSPASVVSAPVGSIYLRTDGGASTTLYVKESGGSGNTGWTAK